MRKREDHREKKMGSNDIFDIEAFSSVFGSDILGTSVRNPKRVFVRVNPDALVRISENLYRERGFRFIIASALQSREGFEIYYHFSMDRDGLVLSLKVLLSKEDPQIESLSNMFNASNWIEREIHELFGINFLNHPNQEKLISEGNWAEGVYPFRKEFK